MKITKYISSGAQFLIYSLIISLFIINESNAQEPGKKQAVVNEKSVTKDTVLSRKPELWITRVIQSINWSAWSVSASAGPSVFSGDIKQFDWFPMSHKYINDKLISQVDATVPAADRVGSAANSKLSERKWAGVFSINKQFGTMLSVQAEYLFGSLCGVSYKTYVPGEKYDVNGNPITALPYHSDYFLAKYHEFDVKAVVNLNKLLYPYLGSGRFGMYVFGGMGLMTFKSSLKDLKTDVSLNDATGILHPKNADYKKYVVKEAKSTETSFPIGIGMRYQLTPHWKLFLEYTDRRVNTDKLDSWSNALSEHDSYQVINLGLNFSIGKVSDSLLDSKIKPQYKLNKVARATKERLEARVDSLQKVMGDLGHRVSVLEEGNKISADSLKSVERRLMQTIPQSGLNTMTFSPTDAVTQLLVVFFDFNKFVIPEKYHGNVALVARILKSDPNVTVQIVGHADKIGSEKYNMELSQKRADAVAFELKDAYGIDPSRLSNVVSKGKSDPLSSKYDDVNRRVDFIFTKPVQKK